MSPQLGRVELNFMFDKTKLISFSELLTRKINVYIRCLKTVCKLLTPEATNISHGECLLVYKSSDIAFRCLHHQSSVL